MSTASSLDPVVRDPSLVGDGRGDGETIALVGLAHGTSHFFHLLLPPLFPMLAAQYGFSYTELGLLVTVFFVISGVGQALAGFLVDRVGAFPVLLAAMACFAMAALAAATAQGYEGFMVAAAIAGLGNAPFHPADFSILNQRVRVSRLGHAFSVHGISGNLGWAAAPLVITAVSNLSGSWRWSMVCCAAWAVVMAILLWWRAAALTTIAAVPPATTSAGAAHRPSDVSASPSAPVQPALAFLRLPEVWVCFMFFFWSTCALAAVQSFVGPALSQRYGEPLEWLALMVTGYMVASAIGMISGGFLVKSSPRLEQNIALALAAAAILLVLAGSAWLPSQVSGVLVALAGFGTGLAGPSRDMLIRQAAPAGATGRVYGAVYSGLDVGFAFAAPAFGAMLDHGMPLAVFVGSGLGLLFAVAAAAWVSGRTARRSPAGA